MGIRLFALAAIAVGATGCGVVLPAETQDSELACSEPPDGDWEVGDREVPDVVGAGPAAAEAAFDRAGIAVSWRYSYATQAADGGGQAGYSECWCVAPPDGVVQDVAASDDGWLIVMVQRSQPMPGGRDQPRLGWGCETLPSSTPAAS